MYDYKIIKYVIAIKKNHFYMWPYLLRYIFSPSQIDIFRLSIQIYLSAHNDLFLRKTILTCVHIVLYILYCIGTLELKFGRKGSANKKHLVIILHTFKCSCRNVMILDLWTWLPLYCAMVCWKFLKNLPGWRLCQQNVI